MQFQVINNQPNNEFYYLIQLEFKKFFAVT